MSYPAYWSKTCPHSYGIEDLATAKTHICCAGRKTRFLDLLGCRNLPGGGSSSMWIHSLFVTDIGFRWQRLLQAWVWSRGCKASADWDWRFLSIVYLQLWCSATSWLCALWRASEKGADSSHRPTLKPAHFVCSLLFSLMSGKKDWTLMSNVMLSPVPEEFPRTQPSCGGVCNHTTR